MLSRSNEKALFVTGCQDKRTVPLSWCIFRRHQTSARTAGGQLHGHGTPQVVIAVSELDVLLRDNSLPNAVLRWEALRRHHLYRRTELCGGQRSVRRVCVARLQGQRAPRTGTGKLHHIGIDCKAFLRQTPGCIILIARIRQRRKCIIMIMLEERPRQGLSGNPRFVNMVIAALEYRKLRFERVWKTSRFSGCTTPYHFAS